MSAKNPFEHRAPHNYIGGVDFQVYSHKDITALSCREICNPKTFDQLGHPVEGGLYDPALGPLERNSFCKTCEQPEKTCPGHFGYIILPVPAFNPAFFRLTLDFLKGSCLNCYKLYSLKANVIPVELLLAQFRALNLGYTSAVDELRNLVTQTLSQHVSIADDTADSSKVDADVLMNTLFSQGNYEEMQELLDYLKNAYKEGENETFQCRNAVQKRQELTKLFCQKYLFKRPRRCPHCKVMTSAVRHHYYQSILVGTHKKSWKMDLLKKQVKVEDENLWTNDDRSLRRPAFGNADVLEQMKNMDKELKEMEEEIVESLRDENETFDAVGGPKVVETSSRQEGGSKFYSPLEVKQLLRKVYENDGDFISKLFPMFRPNGGDLLSENISDRPTTSSGALGDDWCPIDSLFYDVIPVIPSKFRPVNRFSGQMFESAQSMLYKKILETSQTLRCFVNMAKGVVSEFDTVYNQNTPGRTPEEKMHNIYVQLQMAVNSLYDSDLDKISRQKLPGIRQVLEKKEGLFRKHMMGKRVNYACRTVITPDPYQEIDQIGIPDIFAKKLTYPTCVNPINVTSLRDVVIKGPNCLGGANFVINEDGAKIRLDVGDVHERESAAKRLLFNDRLALSGCKKVYRHLTEGDIMLLNRQPTLHKPSIQAHKARILTKQKVIRLHYAVCKPYNADFDGDEMNGHFCQNDVARAEGYEIAAVPYQYLVPKDGTPVLGLIQDHIVSGVLLTLKDNFFTKEDYQYLVLNAFGYLNQKLKYLKPAILKPVVRWTGKQVVSTIILNVIPDGYPALNLTGKAKTSLKSWQVVGKDMPPFEMSESETIFRDGQLLCGVLDKADYGPTAFGLVHCCYELYHPKIAARMLSCFSRLFTTFLQYHGFSLGVADVLVSEKADHKRKKILKELRRCGPDVVKEVFGIHEDAENLDDLMKFALEEIYSNDDTSHVKQLDYSMKTATDKFNDKVNKACLPHGLLKLFPSNSLQVMIECGAKGNMVNQVQMSCMLGQIELEGCRPPLTPSGRTLPSFRPYDPSPRAGGFVDGRFATGIGPQEFFFHTMAGREGLIDTAVKTSRSGYLQRCIVKHLEGIIVNYDFTVRDSDNSVIQFYYGEDGLDIGKSQFLNEKRMQILCDNLKILEKKFSSSNNKGLDMTADKAEKIHRKIKRWKRKHGKLAKIYSSPFLTFSSMHTDMSAVDKTTVLKTYNELTDVSKRNLDFIETCPSPVMSKLNPCRNFGCLPEQLMERLDNFLTNDSTNCFSKNVKKMESYKNVFFWKTVRSMCEPGEAVGVLAAQSIGEPSTQMTLNTFHFAGRGEMNVTLGIPRLREILMAASARIATPTAQVPFLQGVEKTVAENVQRRMDRIFLKQVVKSFKVTELRTVSILNSYSTYVVELKFLKSKNRSVETKHLSNGGILAKVEHAFFKQVSAILMKKIDKYKQEAKNSIIRINKNSAYDISGNFRNRAGEDDDENDFENEEAADDDRRRQRQNDETEYIGEDEEKLEVQFSDEEGSSDEEENTGRELENDVMDIDAQVDQDANRVKSVVDSGKLIIAYDYDTKGSTWCKATLQVTLNAGTVDVASVVKDQLENFVIQQVPGIRRCLLREDGDKLLLLTEGINLQSFFERASLLDVTKLTCNDIHTISKTYGVEAAFQSLMKEVKMVFGAYGIVVDHRHLSLVADYMTHTGEYMAFNRTYMNTSASPFQKMSFETTTNYLKAAILSGEKEELKTPSSQLVVGKLPTVGTGCFDLLVDVA